ncbi:MBL fold metallo-hydrolase [Microbulbifer agarilyticus]|uniref:MBL fold metallo-hydrolase n=1 Tax=Microbulbifer agarilyticus TaxID=260552 RepID=UPI001C962121|nr:MBL fold metallo-hydrolase [Microbulbifer agarilyticus]MBY6191091.1 MBL fold metallo-hydrolase [Microbulbifer agarilyticus]
MNLNKKITFTLGAIAIVAVVLFSQRAHIAPVLLERALPRIMAADALAELGDGLHVAVCGAGSPMADPQRSGPCLLVMAGDNLLMVDAGSGGAKTIGMMRLPIGEIDAVLLTHFHSDHIDGLGEVATLRWASSANTSPLPVIAPEGVEPVVQGFNLAYSHDVQYRHDHHGDTVAPLSGKGMVAQPFAVPADGVGEIVWDRDGLRVTAFRVEHAPVEPAVGYRFDYAGRSVVISGDTVQSPNLEHFAKGADLLLHEALSRKLVGIIEKVGKQTGNAIAAKVMYDIQDYHTDPREAAESARRAGVGHLALYHLVPPLRVPAMEAIFVDGLDEIYSGPVTVTRDGTLFSLPTGSDEIRLVSEGL